VLAHADFLADPAFLLNYRLFAAQRNVNLALLKFMLRTAGRFIAGNSLDNYSLPPEFHGLIHGLRADHLPESHSASHNFALAHLDLLFAELHRGLFHRLAGTGGALATGFSGTLSLPVVKARKVVANALLIRIAQFTVRIKNRRVLY